LRRLFFAVVILLGALGCGLLLLFRMRQWDGLPVIFWASPIILVVGILLFIQAGRQGHSSQRAGATPMLLLGILFLGAGVLAVIVSFLFRIQHWEGARLVSAAAPLLGGVGAVLLMVNKRRRDKKAARERFRGDNF
jgi:O-antigen/teichoic acid export membrane protein